MSGVKPNELPDEAELAGMSRDELVKLGARMDGVEIVHYEDRWPVKGTRAEKRAERLVALWFTISALAGLAFLVATIGKYGDQWRRFDGVDVTLNVRMANGLTLQGGTSTGRGLRDTCEIDAVLPCLDAETLPPGGRESHRGRQRTPTPFATWPGACAG